jgi:hypothetical protein
MKRIALYAAVMALLVAGCGGGDSLSKAALVKQANAICVKYSDKAKALGDANLKDPAMAEAYFSKAGDLAKAQLDELKALKPGDEEKGEFDKLTSAYSDAIGLLGDLADAAGKQDRDAGTRLITELTPISETVDETARSIGAASCASPAG